MAGGEVRITVVGDVQPNREDPSTLFEKVESELAWGDLRYCQLECTLSTRGELRTDVRNPAHRVSPRNIEAITSAGFNVVSYAGNNNLDYGLTAFRDTLELLGNSGIRYFGAGENIDEARKPIYTEINGTTIGWVNFCSILRDGYEATAQRPGISPLKIKTFYEPLENIYEQPGTPSRTVTEPDPDYLAAAMDSVREARQKADFVIGCFHWGVHFTHDLATYQPKVAYAAIDNGCDLILGTHPHCLQAVDVYRGKPIFYSLGNFAFEQPEGIAKHGVAEYLSFYGIPPERDVPVHPHPRHCRYTVMLKILIRGGQLAYVNMLPVFFTNEARPEIQPEGTTEHDRISGLIQALSGELGTEITHVDGSLGLQLEKAEPLDARELLEHRKISYPWLRVLGREGLDVLETASVDRL